MLFDSLPRQVSIDRQIECVQRELAFRRRVYPKLVANGKMTRAKMDVEIECMEAVLQSLESLRVAHSS